MISKNYYEKQNCNFKQSEFQEGRMEMNKCSVLVLPTQYGKTFQTLKYLKEELEKDEIEGKSLHIILTMNTMLNNQQFSQRLNDLETQEKNSICVLSSKNQQNQYNHEKNVIDVVERTKSERMKVLLMCGNRKRFQDTLILLSVLSKMTTTTEIKRIYLYFDEFHRVIHQISEWVELLENNPLVKGILGMTASPNRIFHHLTGLKMASFTQYTNPNYVGTNDMNYVRKIEWIVIS